MKLKPKLILGFLSAALLLLLSPYFLFPGVISNVSIASQIVGIIIVLASLSLFSFMINKALKPLNILEKEASLLAEGTFRFSEKVKSHDELKNIEESLNKISNSWKNTLEEKSKEVESTQEHMRDTFNRLSQAITTVFNQEELLTLILDIAKEELQLNRVLLYLMKDKSNEIDFQIGRGLGPDTDDYYEKNWTDEAFKAAKNPRTMSGKASEIFPLLSSKSSEKDKNLVITFPIVIKNNVSGVILGEREETKGDFSDKDIELLNTLGNQTAIALENAQLYKKNQMLAITDGLTNLHNHYFFQKRLSEELRRADRYTLHLALLMIDIDHFKKYNDTYGHPAGDIVLKDMAKIFMKNTRATDFTARYGGEEFTIILPETNNDGAMLIAERIFNDVRKHGFPGKNPRSKVKMTISMGISYYPREETTAAELIKKADQKLYQAKKSGRDQIVT